MSLSPQRSQQLFRCEQEGIKQGAGTPLEPELDGLILAVVPLSAPAGAKEMVRAVFVTVHEKA